MATLYRIIEYQGDQEWIDKQLDMSIHEPKILANGVITVATIDPDDEVSISFARNKIRQLIATIAPIAE